MTRDVWRERRACPCFARVRARWQAEVTTLAGRFAHQHRIAALDGPDARIVAARRWTFEDRHAGKLNLSLGALDGARVRRALVLTDSAHDLTRLDACAHPLRAVWPEARFRHALSGVYRPGQHLTQLKRPGVRYIVSGILQEDFAFRVRASVALAAVPALHVPGLGFLLVSSWAICERGHVDHDPVAARYEAEPKLTEAFHAAPVWAAALLGTHFGVPLCNRLDKRTRVWLFADLRFARSAAFVALVPIVPAGALALGAHVLACWVPCHVYRLGGKAGPGAPLHGAAPLVDPRALALPGGNLFRACQAPAAAWSSAARLVRMPHRHDHQPVHRHPPPSRTARRAAGRHRRAAAPAR